MEFKVNPILLKEETLRILNDHNSIEGNRKLKPINWYGNITTSMSLFWALWNDDNNSTHTLGFSYKGETLVEFWKDEEILSIEEALEKLKLQLSTLE